MRTLAVLFALAIMASVFSTMLLPHRAHALLGGLLHEPTLTLKKVTHKVLEPIYSAPATRSAPVKYSSLSKTTTRSQPSSPATSSNKSSNANDTTALAATQSSHSSGSSQSTSPATKPLAESNIDGSAPLDPYATTLDVPGQNRQVSFASASFLVPNKKPFVLLNATSQGWELLGVLWYWWASLAAVIAGGIMYYRKHTQKNDFEAIRKRGSFILHHFMASKTNRRVI